jgi:hypothetical protein
MSQVPSYYSHLSVAQAALGFAHSYTLAALEGDPSRLLLEAAINEAKIALWYLTHAAEALENAEVRSRRLKWTLVGRHGVKLFAVR